MFDLLLLSVLISSAYLGTTILRRFGPQQRVYGLMILADFTLALYAYISRAQDGPNANADTVGFVAIGAGVCLVIIPPIVRDLGRKAMGKGWLGTAKFLAELRELLQPGMGARAEIQLIETILAVRLGREQEIVDVLDAQRAATDVPFVHRMLDERIIMTLLYAQRWADATLRYQRLASTGRRPGSPQLTVEMIRAFCEVKEMDTAAELVQLISDSKLADEPALQSLFARGHLVFLAFTGQVSAIEALCAPNSGGLLAEMPEFGREYWLGIGRLHAGDVAGAKACLENVVAHTKDDPQAQKVALLALAKLSDEPDSIGPHPHSETVIALATRLASLHTSNGPKVSAVSPSTIPSLNGIPLGRMPVTVGMALANIVASIAVYVSYGNISDLGSLIAVGANLKSATLSGEWWRLGSSMFLHVGAAHLILNVYGLWILGRLVEQIHGRVRTFAIYMAAGLAGAGASTFFGAGSTSVGASGAVMGLMGAAVAELWLYRKQYPETWSRPLLKMLVYLAVAQVAIGFFYPIIDQLGHVGGLLGGALVGALVSRNGIRGAGLRRLVGGLLTLLAVGYFGYVGYSVGTQSYTQTIQARGFQEHTMSGLKVLLPKVWQRDTDETSKVGESSTRPAGLFVDPGTSSRFTLQRISTIDEAHRNDGTLPGEAISMILAAEQKDERFDRVEVEESCFVGPIPSNWACRALYIVVEEQHFRLYVFAREVPDELWLGTYFHPAALSRFVESAFAKILLSLR